jgi:two-component system, cell cycle response regulator
MRILIADDEETLRTVIQQVLASDGHEITTAASGEEALEHFRREPFPIVISDILMGSMTGLELLEEVKRIEPDTAFVVMTSHASLETATTALRAGAYDYLTKPFEDLDMISAVVGRAIEKIRLGAENRRLLEDLKKKTEELEVLNASLLEMANKDGLTGLFNHRYFREALDREVARARRYNRSFALILMDLDHFKLFNDTHGHLAGDDALRTVAEILRAHSRASSMAARYGGEEFVILIPEATKQDAFKFAERLRDAVRTASFPSGRPGEKASLTLSLGVSAWAVDGTDSATLIAAADRAMYQAKEAGRDRVCV